MFFYFFLRSSASHRADVWIAGKRFGKVLRKREK